MQRKLLLSFSVVCVSVFVIVRIHVSVCVNLGSIILAAAAIQQEVTENLGRAGVKVTVEKAMRRTGIQNRSMESRDCSNWPFFLALKPELPDPWEKTWK